MVPVFSGSQTSGWRVGHVHDGSVHVEPAGDLIDHQVEECVCLPAHYPEKRGDGSLAWVVVHHALDQREVRERQEAS